MAQSAPLPNGFGAGLESDRTRETPLSRRAALVTWALGSLCGWALVAAGLSLAF